MTILVSDLRKNSSLFSLIVRFCAATMLEQPATVAHYYA